MAFYPAKRDSSHLMHQNDAVESLAGLASGDRNFTGITWAASGGDWTDTGTAGREQAVARDNERAPFSTLFVADNWFHVHDDNMPAERSYYAGHVSRSAAANSLSTWRSSD